MTLPQELARVEHKIGYVFRNKSIGCEALNAGSARLYGVRRNDSLAILGDKAIDLVLAALWYRARDPNGSCLTKGDIATLQRDLTSNEGLAARGFDHDLDSDVIKNDGHQTRISDKMMATAVEAIIGAVFLDSGHDHEAVRTVMDRLGFFEHPLLSATDCSSLAGPSTPALDG